MRKLAIVLVIVAVLAIAGDFALKRIAEARAATVIGNRAGLETTPKVTFDGWPFTINVLRGQFPSMTIEVRGAGRGGLRVKEADLKLNKVTFSPTSLIAGNTSSVEFASGTGRAVLTDDELTNALQERDVPVTVKLDGGGVEVSGEGIGSASGDLSLDGNELILTATGGLDPIAIRLPALGRGVTYESMSLEDGEAAFELNVSPQLLRNRG